jgi:hypothetical protein
LVRLYRRPDGYFGLDLRSLRVVARRLRDGSELGLNRLEKGATAVGIVVLRRFSWWAQLLGAAAAVIALWALYTVLDGILKPTFDGVGPSWLHEELGILATGAICLVVGVVLARRIARPSPAL